MIHKVHCVLPIVVLLALAGPGCGEEGTTAVGDLTVVGDLAARDLGDAAVDGVQDALDPGGWDVAKDGLADQAASSDDGTPEIPRADDGLADGTPVDLAGEADAPPVFHAFCRSFDDCEDDEVCEFSLGACQRRGTWLDPAIDFYGFHPAAAAPGDWLVLDGTVFYIPGFMGGSPKSVKIGSVSGDVSQADENRILVKVTANMQGVITITDPNGKSASLPTHFQQAPAGVIACDTSTPAASGVPGPDSMHVGPYAAGYVDLNDDGAGTILHQNFEVHGLPRVQVVAVPESPQRQPFIHKVANQF